MCAISLSKTEIPHRSEGSSIFAVTKQTNKMEDYILYTKQQAIDKLPEFNGEVGKEFVDKSNGRNFKVQFVMLAPAEPDKRKEFTDLIYRVSLHLESRQLLYDFEDNYVEDKYTLIIFGITTSGTPNLFHVRPLHWVIDKSGQLVEGFGI